MSKAMKALRAVALKLPATTEGVACEGTALEKRTVKTGAKAFLFLGPGDALLKLQGSLAEATELAAQAPERYRVGKGGWVKIVFDDGGEVPRMDVLSRWIAESHALAATTAVTARPTRKTRKTGTRTTKGKKRSSRR